MYIKVEQDDTEIHPNPFHPPQPTAPTAAQQQHEHWVLLPGTGQGSGRRGNSMVMVAIKKP